MAAAEDKSGLSTGLTAMTGLATSIVQTTTSPFGTGGYIRNVRAAAGVFSPQH